MHRIGYTIDSLTRALSAAVPLECAPPKAVVLCSTLPTAAQVAQLASTFECDAWLCRHPGIAEMSWLSSYEMCRFASVDSVPLRYLKHPIAKRAPENPRHSHGAKRRRTRDHSFITRVLRSTAQYYAPRERRGTCRTLHSPISSPIRQYFGCYLFTAGIERASCNDL